MKNLALRLLSLILLLTTPMFSSCGGNDEPNNPNSGTKLKISDLKVEIEVKSSEEFKYNITVTKGFEPNIYRDGKLVAQGNYYQDEYISTKELKTTITHKGQAIVCGLIINKVRSDEEIEDFPVSIKFKVYQDGKLVDEYTQNKVLKNTGITEQVGWYAKAE